MRIIDRYAYQNRISRLDPACKTGIAFGALLLCLLLNKPLVGLTTIAWMYFLAVFWARLNWRVFGKVLLAESAFLILASLGVFFSVSLKRDVGSLWDWRLASFWISVSRASLQQGMLLIARAAGAASAMNFLTLTTPLMDLLELSRRWRIPAILVDLTAIIYRFVFVLLDRFNIMFMAQDSRLGYTASYARTMNSAGLLGSRLFINAFQHSRRLQLALESRGYEGGDFRALPSTYQPCRYQAWIGVAVFASLFAVWGVT